MTWFAAPSGPSPVGLCSAGPVTPLHHDRRLSPLLRGVIARSGELLRAVTGDRTAPLAPLARLARLAPLAPREQEVHALWACDRVG